MVPDIRFREGTIIDNHVHISDIPDPAWNAPPFLAEQLLRLMDGPYMVAGEARHVGIAVAQPGPGISIKPGWDHQQIHEYIVKAVRQFPDRIIGCMMINPHLGLEQAFAELEHLVKDEGFRMIKMHPTFHHYWPNKSKHLTYPIMEQARRLGIPVMIHTGDPPFSVPALTAPLAEAFRDVNIILAHFGTQKTGYADDAVEVARKQDNVFLGTDWGHLMRIKEGIQTLGPSKLVFGTDGPITEIGMGLRAIEVCCWQPPIGINMPESDRERIFGGNMAELLGLT
ncbi:MAG: amidohydrolase [Chloroflexi bacterium]|nr:amidohydrolase [Chloroflexota bacterium]